MWSRSARLGPLVRPVDRIQRRCFLTLVVLAIALIPVAVLFGVRNATSQLDLIENRRAELTSVSATVVDSEMEQPQAEFVSGPETADIEWNWHGQIRHGTAMVPPSTESGTEIDVWVDRGGALSPPPTTHSAAVVGGIALATFTWLSVVVLATIGYQFGRMRWDRIRYQKWDRDLRAFLDSTTRY
ncbi:hypothetical protein [Rhodococcus sp. NPDC058521]|uniref:Rv1733c family protein n=1 Tax=Rhodococcus sp. NPDC058521 TaxID=3346536 RepID=UPI003659FF8E